MIVELEGTTTEDVAVARQSLDDLARSWGHGVAPVETVRPMEVDRPGERGLDPVAVAALVVSIPSAALAVHDLVDRIRNRRRAKELIDRAEELRTQQVTVRVVLPEKTVELTALTSDQLLELIDDEKPTS